MTRQRFKRPRGAQGHLTGRLGRIDGKPFAADRDSIGISVSITHGHRAHVDVETEQHPGMGRGPVLLIRI
jgi:hypothetical protein